MVVSLDHVGNFPTGESIQWRKIRTRIKVASKVVMVTIKAAGVVNKVAEAASGPTSRTRIRIVVAARKTLSKTIRRIINDSFSGTTNSPGQVPGFFCADCCTSSRRLNSVRCAPARSQTHCDVSRVPAALDSSRERPQQSCRSISYVRNNHTMSGDAVVGKYADRRDCPPSAARL
jgi:hypothetical protein